MLAILDGVWKHVNEEENHGEDAIRCPYSVLMGGILGERGMAREGKFRVVHQVGRGGVVWRYPASQGH